MIKRIKRSELVNNYILNWSKSDKSLKVLCTKDFTMEGFSHPDFIKGYVYKLQPNIEDSFEFSVRDSNKETHFIFRIGKKNKFFHKHFDILRTNKKS